MLGMRAPVCLCVACTDKSAYARLGISILFWREDTNMAWPPGVDVEGGRAVMGRRALYGHTVPQGLGGCMSRCWPRRRQQQQQRAVGARRGEA
jgi:hypothetical protein